MSLSLPSAPTGFPQNPTVLSVTSTVIQLGWDPVPIDQRNGNITHYEVELNQTSFPQGIGSFELRATTGPELSINLIGLEAFVEYTMRVRAYTSAGYGPFSSAVSDSTLTDSE